LVFILERKKFNPPKWIKKRNLIEKMWF
jgi:hypothetical protein